MKIAIIGAGFYGTYIAYKFSKNNKHQVDIFEKNKQICSEVVKNNQYRLHTGFHYPRSLETIAQTLKGYKLFIKEFKQFIELPKYNIYLIKKKSKVSFKKYKHIYKKLKIPYKEINLDKFKNYLRKENFLGGINTKEGVIKINQLVFYLHKIIKNKLNIYSNSEVIKIDNLKGSVFTQNKKFHNYDLIINTTYSNPNLGLKKKKFILKYELTGMLKLKNPYSKSLGLTVMDGNFCSLYPYNKKYSTISSVKFTPIFKTNTFKNLLLKKNKIRVNKIKKNLLKHAQKDFLFSEKIKNLSLILSYKVKLKNDFNALRTSNIIKENKQISILCGKLDAALVVYDEIIKLLKT